MIAQPRFVIASLSVLLIGSVYAADVVTTIAGTGTPGFSGDGGQALSANLNDPLYVRMDAAGNLLFTDYSNNRIRKITPAGIVSTIAGTGTAGFSGDGGPATAAQLRGPVDLVLDATGNIYFSDQQNHRVRKIATDGTISTIAGTGTAGLSNDGMQATTAQINTPGSMVIDNNGDLIFGDLNNSRYRKVTISTGVITTVVGTTQGFGGDTMAATAAQINLTSGVGVNAANDIFLIDPNNERIRKVNASDGKINTIAGTGVIGYTGDGGAALGATFHFANGGSIGGALTVGPDGSIFASDAFNAAIRVIDTGNNINTLIGTGTPGFNGDGLTPTATQLNNPAGVIMPATGGFIFCDVSNHRIRRLFKNPPPPTSVSVVATALSGGVPFETRSVKSGTNVTFTASSVDPNNIQLQYAWDFGDGTNASGNPVSHTFNVASGQQTFTVSVTGSHANGSVVGTLPLDVAASANPGVPNISQGKSAVVNPLNNVQLKLQSSDGGVLELDVSGTVAGRAARDVTTDFDGVLSRISSRPGFRPLQGFSDAGIVIATTNVVDSAGKAAGKARKTLVVSRKEVGQSGNTPSSNAIGVFSVKGKFAFGKSGALSAPRPDSVTFSGVIELPAGLDLSQAQNVVVSVGNIADGVTVSPKGKATGASAKGRIKKLQVKYPKLAKGSTTTVSGGKATVTLTLSDLSLSANGFDTDGISNTRLASEASLKSFPRNIQVGVLFAGTAYELLMPVDFKLSKKDDAGTIAGRSSTKK